METDVLVIGSGPAGLQAAIHAVRKAVRVLVVGKASNSAVAGTRIENYFGMPPTDGNVLLSNGEAQTKEFGCAREEVNVLSMSAISGGFEVKLETGGTVLCKAVVLATGVSRVKLGVPGEKEFFGKGVSYCAACDCNFYKGKTVVVFGNESEAAESAALMTKYATKTYWIHDKLDVSKALEDTATEAGVESVDGAVKSIEGSGNVEHVVLSDGRIIAVDGIFIELGGRSSADLAMDLDIMPEVDDTIKVDGRCATSVPGVFACGDITGRPWQVAKAVGQGAVAGLSAAEYAKEKR